MRIVIAFSIAVVIAVVVGFLAFRLLGKFSSTKQTTASVAVALACLFLAYPLEMLVGQIVKGSDGSNSTAPAEESSGPSTGSASDPVVPSSTPGGPVVDGPSITDPPVSSAVPKKQKSSPPKDCSGPFEVIVNDSSNDWVAPGVVANRATIQVTAWASGPCGAIDPCYMTYTAFENDVQIERKQDDCSNNENSYFKFGIKSGRNYRYIFDVSDQSGNSQQKEWSFSVQSK
ncbi:hypothetical protein [Amycolatopsis magusensis]|uniref:hypothetical protein n=1 Tax=Amycolatopsis magusensis TaxID=882444 RepID=UPI0037BDDB7C